MDITKRINFWKTVKVSFLTGSFLLSACANIYSQEKFSVHLDILGAAPYVSLNVEKSIIKKARLEIKARAGIGLTGYDVVQAPRTFIKHTPSFPAGIVFLSGRQNKKNSIEIGVSGTYIKEMSVSDAWDPTFQYRDNIKNTVLASAFFGYRFRTFNRRGILRVGYNPILLKNKLISWGALTFGWAFIKKKIKVL